MPQISFFSEGLDFQLPKPIKIKKWILEIAGREKKKIASLSYIFCEDEFLSQLNEKYLKHKTLTDIITFDYSEKVGEIEGEIYISLPRVRENSVRFHTQFEQELQRVMIHGVLHLAGYKDKKPSEKASMRKKEEACLSLLNKVSRGTK